MANNNQSGGTVNNVPTNKRKTVKANRRSGAANRRRNKKKSKSGKINRPLPKPIVDQISDQIEDTTEAMVEKIGDLTVKPFKRLLTPNGIGAAVAIATKSPVAGLLTMGALSTTGSVVKGLGKFTQALQDQLMINQSKKDMQQGMKNNNNDILDALIELVHNNKLILDEAKLTRLDTERAMFKQLEQQRELTDAEKERSKLLAQLADTMSKLKITSKDAPKGFLGKAFEWLMHGVLGGLGLQLVSGKVSIKPGIAKGLARILNPLVLITSLYKGIKGAFEGWIKRGNIEGIISGALSGIVELFTFGLIKSDKAESAIYKAVDAITDGIGILMFKAYEALKQASISIVNFDYVGMFSKLLDNTATWLAESFNEELQDWKNILEQLGVTQWFDSITETLGGLFDKLKNAIAKLFEVLLDKVAATINIIPGVDIALTDKQREKKINKEIADLEEKKRVIGQRSETKGWFGIGAYTQEEKLADLERINGRITSLKTGVEPQGSTGSALEQGLASGRIENLLGDSPGKQKSIATIQNNMENNKLKGLKVYPSWDPTKGAAGPQQNTVVSSQNTNNFVGPVSKRNNENTFIRTQDKNFTHPGL